jgi:hypothetical protein
MIETLAPERNSPKSAEALYGPAWRAGLAQALEVSERTVKAVGRRRRDQDLAALCRRQAAALTKLAEQLEAPDGRAVLVETVIKAPCLLMGTSQKSGDVHPDESAMHR